MTSSDTPVKSCPPFTTAELDYFLPPELIALQPLARRDNARLLVLDRSANRLFDQTIASLPELLKPGDLLILNDTRVIPARFEARRQTGGRVEGLFLSEESVGTWIVMLEGSRRLKTCETLTIQNASAEHIRLTLLENLHEGSWRLAVEPPKPATEILNQVGLTPLPPYIRKNQTGWSDTVDRERYQTVYAAKPGAIAAPTAGLHFTPDLLTQIHDRGIETARLTLHVGVGTFKPIAVDLVKDHAMHFENYEIPLSTLEAVQRCKARGNSVVAVGTTSVRVLETVARSNSSNQNANQNYSGSTNIFIYPPYDFKVVDALLTNFHLPRSTLLALVMAFAGIEQTRAAYEHAIKNQYRFYSYGDAMLMI